MRGFGEIMVNSKHTMEEEILNRVGDDKKSLVERLRMLIKGVIPKVAETGQGKRISRASTEKGIAALRSIRQHVDLLFLRVIVLSASPLKGKGTIGDPKHLEGHNLENFDYTGAKRLLRKEAATVQMCRRFFA